MKIPSTMVAQCSSKTRSCGLKESLCFRGDGRKETAGIAHLIKLKLPSLAVSSTKMIKRGHAGLHSCRHASPPSFAINVFDTLHRLRRALSTPVDMQADKLRAIQIVHHQISQPDRSFDEVQFRNELVRHKHQLVSA